VKMVDVTEADFPAVAALAKSNDLLLEDLTVENFPAMLKWLYFDTPSGTHLEFVAKEGEAVIAHYGALPFAFQLGGETQAGVVAGFASNLVIDKANRTGSLFFSLQNHFFREYPKKNLAFAYGLVTRDGVLEPHLRMGWKKLGEVPVFAKPINFNRVAATVVKNGLALALGKLPLTLAGWALTRQWLPSSRSITVEQVDRFDHSLAPVLESLAGRFKTMAVRTPEILNWRFKGLSTRTYSCFVAKRAGVVIGYMVLRKLQMKGLEAMALVDMAYDPADSASGRELMRACTREAIRGGADLVATILNPNSPFRGLLTRAGFLQTSESFKLVVHRPKSSTLQLDASSFPHWHLTWFDHDYV